MSMRAAMANGAHWMRRFRPVHRALKWIRRTLWRALAEGFWECARIFFANWENVGPPLRTFSAYQALRNGWPRIQGRILLHDQGHPEVRDGSLLVKCGFEQYAYQPWPVFWSEHSEVRLVAQSLACLTGPKEVLLESVYGHLRMRIDPACRYLRLPAPVRLTGAWTSLVSRWVPTGDVPNYTHWLMDALPRLGVLSEFPPETGILVPGTLAPYQEESLELLGLLDRCRFTRETHFQVERYFFSPPTSELLCYNPYAVHFLRRVFLPKADPAYNSPRRFFIKRVGRARPLQNADEVERFFQGLGWAVIDTETLTFAREIQLFASAEAVCGLAGSGLTNTVFCPPGCRVINLAPDFLLDGWLDWIVQVVGADYTFQVLPTGYVQEIRLPIPWLQAALRQAGERL
ncbi:MAG: glycosyltransferase family 61 protein [Verrucomicrobia bacterium]|nr:glycosyltransferase family 61 protein [Verrucomicrobiota bacterium]